MVSARCILYAHHGNCAGNIRLNPSPLKANSVWQGWMWLGCGANKRSLFQTLANPSSRLDFLLRRQLWDSIHVLPVASPLLVEFPGRPLSLYDWTLFRTKIWVIWFIPIHTCYKCTAQRETWDAGCEKLLLGTAQHAITQGERPIDLPPRLNPILLNLPISF